MLRDSVVVVVVVVVRTRPRAIPLAMITIRKSFMGFLFFPVMTMGLRLAALRAAGAPLLILYMQQIPLSLKFVTFRPNIFSWMLEDIRRKERE